MTVAGTRRGDGPCAAAGACVPEPPAVAAHEEVDDHSGGARQPAHAVHQHLAALALHLLCSRAGAGGRGGPGWARAVPQLHLAASRSHVTAGRRDWQAAALRCALSVVTTQQMQSSYEPAASAKTACSTRCIH